MPNIKDYFAEVTYKPKYLLGDRVRGLWNGIPFAGVAGGDSRPDPDRPAHTVVFLDLPIKHGGTWHTTVQVETGSLIAPEGKYGISSKTNSKKRKVDSN